MVESQREELNKKTSEYLSIGITPGGNPVKAIGIPWETTANAFNMRTPDIFLSPEDLNDEALMAELESYKVIGCYIWAPLEDYSFISRFKDMQDVSIRNADSVRNLDFLKGLDKCRMLFLENAKLDNLHVITELKLRDAKNFDSYLCVSLDNCEVEDISGLENEKLYFSEFLVWKPEGSNEHDRWSVMRASKKKYYEFRV